MGERDFGSGKAGTTLGAARLNEVSRITARFRFLQGWVEGGKLDGNMSDGMMLIPSVHTTHIRYINVHTAVKGAGRGMTDGGEEAEGGRGRGRGMGKRKRRRKRNRKRKRKRKRKGKSEKKRLRKRLKYPVLVPIRTRSSGLVRNRAVADLVEPLYTFFSNFHLQFSTFRLSRMPREGMP